MAKRRCYISGPMTGMPDHNYPAFNEAEKVLVSWGWDVVNPAKNFNGSTDRPRADYMREDIKHVLSVDYLFLLDGWETSEGSKLEVALAQELGLDIRVMSVPPPNGRPARVETVVRHG